MVLCNSVSLWLSLNILREEDDLPIMEKIAVANIGRLI